MLDHSERLCTLLDDARVLGIAGAILGDDFNYAGGDGDFWVGDTPWHPDGNYPDLFAIKFAFYLDPLTRDTGCLRVLPVVICPNPIGGAAICTPVMQESYGILIRGRFRAMSR